MSSSATVHHRRPTQAKPIYPPKPETFSLYNAIYMLIVGTFRFILHLINHVLENCFIGEYFWEYSRYFNFGNNPNNNSNTNLNSDSVHVNNNYRCKRVSISSFTIWMLGYEEEQTEIIDERNGPVNEVFVDRSISEMLRSPAALSPEPILSLGMKDSINVPNTATRRLSTDSTLSDAISTTDINNTLISTNSMSLSMSRLSRISNVCSMQSANSGVSLISEDDEVALKRGIKTFNGTQIGFYNNNNSEDHSDSNEESKNVNLECDYDSEADEDDIRMEREYKKTIIASGEIITTKSESDKELFNLNQIDSIEKTLVEMENLNVNDSNSESEVHIPSASSTDSFGRAVQESDQRLQLIAERLRCMEERRNSRMMQENENQKLGNEIQNQGENELNENYQSIQNQIENMNSNTLEVYLPTGEKISVLRVDESEVSQSESDSEESLTDGESKYSDKQEEEAAADYSESADHSEESVNLNKESNDHVVTKLSKESSMSAEISVTTTATGTIIESQLSQSLGPSLNSSRIASRAGSKEVNVNESLIHVEDNSDSLEIGGLDSEGRSVESQSQESVTESDNIKGSFANGSSFGGEDDNIIPPPPSLNDIIGTSVTTDEKIQAILNQSAMDDGSDDEDNNSDEDTDEDNECLNNNNSVSVEQVQESCNLNATNGNDTKDSISGVGYMDNDDDQNHSAATATTAVQVSTVEPGLGRYSSTFPLLSAEDSDNEDVNQDSPMKSSAYADTEFQSAELDDNSKKLIMMMENPGVGFGSWFDQVMLSKYGTTVGVVTESKEMGE